MRDKTKQILTNLIYYQCTYIYNNARISILYYLDSPTFPRSQYQTRMLAIFFPNNFRNKIKNCFVFTDQYFSLPFSFLQKISKYCCFVFVIDRHPLFIRTVNQKLYNIISRKIILYIQNVTVAIFLFIYLSPQPSRLRSN